MPWFYAPRDHWSGTEIILPADEARHAGKVLRLGVGDEITVIDGGGAVADCRLARNDGPGLVAEILSLTSKEPAQPRFVVYQAALKAGKLDDCVERLAELGVAEIRCFVSERAVARWDPSKIDRLGRRYAAIARTAAKQSRNPFVADIEVGLGWTDLLAAIGAEQVALTLWEEATAPLRSALVPHAPRVAVVVGPEGGFTRDEAGALDAAGSSSVSLGPQILRAENAALVATSALMFHSGLLG